MPCTNLKTSVVSDLKHACQRTIHWNQKTSQGGSWRCLNVQKHKILQHKILQVDYGHNENGVNNSFVDTVKTSLWLMTGQLFKTSCDQVHFFWVDKPISDRCFPRRNAKAGTWNFAVSKNKMWTVSTTLVHWLFDGDLIVVCWRVITQNYGDIIDTW